jgi:hypothetical protein
MTAYTLFSQGNVQPGANTNLAIDNTDYTFGVQFQVSQAMTLTAIWWYSITGAVSLPDFIALYGVTGQNLIHSESAAWSGAVATGWVRAQFASPPSLTASVSYKGCVGNDHGNGNWYSNWPHYWEGVAPGGNGITNGPLSAPNSASAAQGQDSYTAGTPIPSYPASVFNNTNYWVDVEVTTVSGAQPNLLLATLP